MQEVEALAARLSPDGDLVLTMAYLGLRWSELAALRATDIDLNRGRVQIMERATEVGGRMDVSAPKSRASHRSIAIPASLRPTLAARMEERAPDALVFPAPDGGYLRNGNWRNRSGWTTATRELGLTGITPPRPTPHLRQPRPLRRSRPALDPESHGPRIRPATARIYAHLYDDELGHIAAALDHLRTSSPGTE